MRCSLTRSPKSCAEGPTMCWLSSQIQLWLPSRTNRSLLTPPLLAGLSSPPASKTSCAWMLGTEQPDAPMHGSSWFIPRRFRRTLPIPPPSPRPSALYSTSPIQSMEIRFCSSRDHDRSGYVDREVPDLIVRLWQRTVGGISGAIDRHRTIKRPPETRNAWVGNQRAGDGVEPA